MEDERRPDEWLEANRPNTSTPPSPRETVRPKPREATRPSTAAPPPGEQRGPRPGSTDTNRPMVLSILYIVSFFVGLTGLVAFILALAWRAEAAEPWEQSHYDYQIRTFLIWLGAFVAGLFLLFTIVGAFLGVILWFAAWVQVLVRGIMSLVRAQSREAMPNPHTLLA